MFTNRYQVWHKSKLWDSLEVEIPSVRQYLGSLHGGHKTQESP